MKPPIPVRICLAVIGVALQLVAAASGDGPTGKNPAALLPVGSTEESTELMERAGPLYEAVAEEIEQHESNVEANRYAKASKRAMERVADTSLKLYQLKRIAERLVQLNETAGIDLRYRHERLSSRLMQVVTAYKGAENFTQLNLQANRTLAALSDRHERSIQRIESLIEQEKLDLAEKEVDEIYDDLHRPAVFQTRQAADRSYKLFLPLRGAIDAKMSQRRSELVDTQLRQTRLATQPNYEAINKLVADAVNDAQDDGRATWVGQELDGPELIDAWTDGWRKTQLKMLECYALDRLREIPVGATPPSELDQLLSTHRDFEQNMLNAMRQLLESDAGRTSAEQIPELYTRYVQSLARLAALTHDDTIEKTFAPALDQLVQRSKEFALGVAAYKAATQETLRWRRRTAAAYARRYQRDSQSIADLLQAASQKEALQSRPMNADPDVTHLAVSVPLLIEDVAAVAIGKRAFVSSVITDPDGPALSQLDTHFMARVGEAGSVKMPAAELSELRRDLLVADDAPPLSLAAAVAIESASMGRYVTVGGELKGLELFPLLVHLTRDPRPQALPPGDVPNFQQATLKDLLWQFDLKPAWLQHEYIFAEVP